MSRQCECFGFPPCRNREHAIVDHAKQLEAADERGEELAGVQCRSTKTKYLSDGRLHICKKCWAGEGTLE